MTAGTGALTLTVNGSGFLSTSVVQVGTTAEPTTYISATQLSAAVPATQLASGAQLAVAVLNGSASSNYANPTKLEVDNPAPTIASLSPASETMGSTSTLLTVTGTGFVPTTVIDVNGTARTTTFISASQVSLTLTAADVSAVASLSLTAVNPAPGGGTSTAATLAIVASNPTPAITSVNPATEVVGTSSPVIAVNGTGFTPSTVIDVNGNARTTTFTNATQVNVTLAAADVSATGNLSLTAVNPPPGGGTSAAAHVAINNPPVGAIQVSPSTLAAGTTTPATLTVTGDRFVTASVVQVNGSPRSTTYVNTNKLTFVATVADQASAGTLAVTVTNPAPGGGTSPAATVTVTGAGGLAITLRLAQYIHRPIAGHGHIGNRNRFRHQLCCAVEWRGPGNLARLQRRHGITRDRSRSRPGNRGNSNCDRQHGRVPLHRFPIPSPSTLPILLAPTLTSISPNAGPINTAAAVTLTGSGLHDQFHRCRQRRADRDHFREFDATYPEPARPPAQPPRET